MGNFHLRRRILRTRRDALPAVIILSVGLAACTVVFTIFRTAFNRAVPYPHPGNLDLIEISASSIPERIEQMPLARARFLELHAPRDAVFGCYRQLPRKIWANGPDARIRFASLGISARLFTVLGVHFKLGRNFSRLDMRPGATPVAILGSIAAESLFGQSRRPIGSSINIDGRLTRIVGVLPASFHFFAAAGQIYLPVTRSQAAARDSSVFLVSRRIHGESLKQLNAQLASFAARVPREQMDALFGQWTFKAEPLVKFVLGKTADALSLLLLAVLSLQLVICANIAGLFLAQHEARRPEFAVRLALGARPRNIARQLLIESLGIAVPGCVIGLILSWGGVQILGPLVLPAVRHWGFAALSPAVMLFSVGLAMASALVFGVLPAIVLARKYANRIELASAQIGPATPGRLYLHRALVVMQIAGAMAFMVCFALLLENFLHDAEFNQGFQPKGVATVQLLGAPSPPEILSILKRVRSLGGVDAAAITSIQPFSGGGIMTAFGFQAANGAWVMSPPTESATVSPGYFSALHIPIARGRALTARDTSGMPLVAVVSHSLASALWPGVNPVGRGIDLNYGSGKPALARIVGTVPDVSDENLTEYAQPEIYFSILQRNLSGSLSLLLRMNGKDGPNLAAITSAIHQTAPRLKIAGMLMLSQARDQKLYLPRLRTLVAAGFGFLGLAISMLGLYALLSFVVNRRMREFCIRSALGATPGNLFRLMFRESCILAVLGIAAGMAGAISVSHMILSGIAILPVARLSPAACFGAAMIVCAVLLMASSWPALRAARCSTSELLKEC